MSNHRGSRARRAGFTLIELLAVMVILAILIGVLVVSLGDAQRAMDVQITKNTGLLVSGDIATVVDDSGDYPRSNFPSELGMPPNMTNLGIECLYMALCADGAPGDAHYEDKLCNVDNDQLPKAAQGFASTELFELHDQWDNPFAYFHHRDYGRVDLYVTLDPKTGERIESSVSAVKNPQTQRYFNARKYQLISAGPDGDFGTAEDNVTIGFDVKDADEGK
jgi:prepilin-type N-terminal cleavage/methylation domain-containing protein